MHYDVKANDDGHDEQAGTDDDDAMAAVRMILWQCFKMKLVNHIDCRLYTCSVHYDVKANDDGHDEQAGTDDDDAMAAVRMILWQCFKMKLVNHIDCRLYTCSG